MKTLKLTEEQFEHLKLLVDINYERSIRYAPDLLGGKRPPTQKKIDKWSRIARLAEELLVATC